MIDLDLTALLQLPLGRQIFALGGETIARVRHDMAREAGDQTLALMADHARRLVEAAVRSGDPGHCLTAYRALEELNRRAAN